MYDLTTTIIIGMTSSMLASAVFLIFMLRLRPKIILSEHIAHHVDNNKSTYKFKIANIGSRDAVNLKIELNVITIVSIPKGVAHNHKVVNLKKMTRMDLPKYSKKDPDGNYAVRFLIDADLNEEWENDSSQYLRVKVFAQDAVSGFGKLFVQNYRVKRIAIKSGQFEFGRSMEVM